MPDAVLLYGSSDYDFDLFHAVPVSITDPFLYVEADGRRIAILTVLDADNARAKGVEVLDPARFGRDDLIAEGLPVETIETELCVRVCRELGVRAAAVPFGFPLAVADALRSDVVHLDVDQARFVARRRVKTPAELEGIRRAQAAADAAMGAPAEPVLVDIAPRDRASRCWTDMSRTFVAGGGEPEEELARYWELTRESLAACY